MNYRLFNLPDLVDVRESRAATLHPAVAMSTYEKRDVGSGRNHHISHVIDNAVSATFRLPILQGARQTRWDQGEDRRPSAGMQQ